MDWREAEIEALKKLRDLPMTIGIAIAPWWRAFGTVCTGLTLCLFGVAGLIWLIGKAVTHPMAGGLAFDIVTLGALTYFVKKGQE